MSGNDIPASLDTPISTAGNERNDHQDDETQQQPSGMPEHGSGEHRSMSPAQPEGGNSTLGSFPAAVATQALCSKMVEDFRSSKISKGVALSRIHTALVDALPEDLSAVEDSFARYLSIVEDHKRHLTQAKQRGDKRSGEDDEHRDDGEPEPESPASTKHASV
ncbi:uncharacterized protein LACBIDRAFT_322740 [Laccaria bicolor S238N-H82]|uniref:Predicted protein n=1 Tax=Laccaria bicolor (strain S238N-H82 / ATCC MYA-4686) TaxID=486041 RepID=B0CXC6_LACBS|nr:uncharacterized protein LACBIDRAFT_322740 [Laccaria bicolor S238N-H82]EDR13644.1 predicted protein [Laccaria bicolor S238N-H82]|eukprot:XP_001876142.1 predicted protein [Laccaria bicolor S238N-H82]